jgi:dTDP-4-dehydrorhamnose 3,5-epimerase
MQFIPTEIPDVWMIEPKIFGDERGFFMETYRAGSFLEKGIDVEFVQDNHSGSRQGVLRGLHYQIRQPQAKLMRVVSGEIYDVVVDLRRSSPTFGRWVGATLSTQNQRQMWIPEGFAHGFYVLSEWAEIIYKVNRYYAPQWERTLLWNDPALGIGWPLLANMPPLISPRDAQGVTLSQAECFD